MPRLRLAPRSVSIERSPEASIRATTTPVRCPGHTWRCAWTPVAASAAAAARPNSSSPTDANEVHFGSGSGERDGLVGGRPSGGNDDPGSGIAAPVERAERAHDDVDHDVADNDDHWLLRPGRHRWAA